jgi:hypothetical protein
MTAAPPTIAPDMTIREALVRYPHTAAVFERHGLAGCGGPGGPLEPIDQFARLHHVDLPTLLAELEATVRETPEAGAVAASQTSAPGPHAPGVGHQPGPAAPDSYRLYLKTSLLLALTAGFGIGLLAVLSRAGAPSLGAYWLPLIQAHGQVQLLGWVGLFTVGVAYHVVPRFRGVPPVSRRVALVTYSLLLGAVVVRAVAQPLAVGAALPGAFTLAALLQLAGSTLFAVTLLRWLLPHARQWEGYEPYLASAASWLVLAGLLSVAIAVPADLAGRAVVVSSFTDGYLHAMFYGFALLLALGVTRRAIPLFMGLQATNARLDRAAWTLLDAAVALKVSGALGGALLDPLPWRAVEALGAGLLLAGAVAFVAALHLYERAPMPPGPGQPRGHEPFIRTAYGWLLVSLGLSAVVSVAVALGAPPVTGGASAARHALALGFLSLLIFGVASRIVPVFGGVTLWRPFLLVPLYVAFNLGVALRVLGELLGSGDSPGRLLVAVSGVLGYLGLVLFALVLWRTLDARPTVALSLVGVRPGSDGALRPDLTVAEVLARWPATLPVFLAHGFTPLANPALRAALAPRVTLAQATGMRGVDLDRLLAALQAAAGEASEPARPPGVGTPIRLTRSLDQDRVRTAPYWPGRGEVNRLSGRHAWQASGDSPIASPSAALR